MEVGLILLALAIAVNGMARLIIWRSTRKTREAGLI